MPIVVGAPRSGTTLLRFMLDAHPEMAIPPETGFLAAPALHEAGVSAAALHQVVTTFPPDAPAWPDFGVDADDYWRALHALAPFDVAEGIRAFYRLYATGQGKARYGDKTPIYCEHLASIERLLPEAHFVHIIRDGRDASLSLRDLWFSPARDVPALASFWKQQVLAARVAGRTAAAYLEVSYERLVREPRSTLAGVCAFLQIPFDDVMLRYWERTPQRLREHRTRNRRDGTVIVTHEQRLSQQRMTTQPPSLERIDRWRTEMTREEQAEFWRVAGDTLADLGYEPQTLPPFSRP
jgi:hypothetical protein